MNARPKFYLLVVLFTLLLAQACMPVQPEAPAAEAPTVEAPAAEAPAEMETVRVASQPFIGFAPFYIAQEEGFFAEQGLNVEFVPLTPQQIMPALAAGEVDVAAGFAEAGIFNAIGRGGGMKIVADKGIIDPQRCDNYAMILSNRLEGEVSFENPETLKGRVVNLIPASWLDYAWHVVIEPLGLTDADFEYVVVPNNAQSEALTQGTLDIAFTSDPWITFYRNAGHVDIGPRLADVIPNATWGLLYYGPTLTEERTDVGNRFMIAYLKAVRQYNEGTTERNVEIMAPIFNTAPEVLQTTCWPSIHPAGEVNIDSLVGYQEWAQASGYLDAVVPADEFWDGRFIEAANQALGSQ
jgi:NitT/TauT family transport system substrate-binding protein